MGPEGAGQGWSCTGPQAELVKPGRLSSCDTGGTAAAGKAGLLQAFPVLQRASAPRSISQGGEQT